MVDAEASADHSAVKIPSHRVYSEIAAIAKSLSGSPLLPQEFCHAEAYLPTQPPPPGQDPRLPFPHEDQGGCRRPQPPSRQGPSQDCRQRRFPRLIAAAMSSEAKRCLRSQNSKTSLAQLHHFMK